MEEMIYLLNKQLLRFDPYNIISDLLFLRSSFCSIESYWEIESEGKETCRKPFKVLIYQ